ncbi:MAG: hypothetical protein LRZ94_00145 [Candidatus Pacebacteria bacterium]|nr:hypothetical protein [Candidatus Paceibacterota bacterium]
MIKKFLKGEGNKDALIYLVAFVIVIFFLNNFIGIDFEFEKPEKIIIEDRNYLEIISAIEIISQYKDFNLSRSFTPIPPFDGVVGRTNPFISGSLVENLPENINEEFDAGEEIIQEEITE